MPKLEPVRPLVSAVIPTYNRARDARIAVATALSQTYPEIEVIVVDDGSTDGTAEALQQEFGDRIRVLRKANGGVSSARNHGLAAACGDYLALLDSDDEWLPSHVEAQIDLLERRPDFGMVLTDVVAMDERRQELDLFRRRDILPEDGDVLRWVLRNPALVPASATFRRAVYVDVGGFDETLRTAEDLDFHLRVALRWKIAVVEQPLTRAMRGHDGLSELAQTYQDYVGVIESFVEGNRDRIAPPDRDAALLHAYARNARGFLCAGDVREAVRCAVRCARRARTGGDAVVVAKLGADLAKTAALRAHRSLLGRCDGEGR